MLSAPSLLSGLCMQRQEGDQAGAAESHFNTEQRRPKREKGNCLVIHVQAAGGGNVMGMGCVERAGVNLQGES